MINKTTKAFSDINLGDTKEEILKKLTKDSNIKQQKDNTYKLSLFNRGYTLKPVFKANSLEKIQIYNIKTFKNLKAAKAESQFLAQLLEKKYSTPTLHNQITRYRKNPNWSHKWQLATKEITIYIKSSTRGSIGPRFKVEIEISSAKK